MNIIEVYYVQWNDKETKRKLEKQVHMIDGKRMKYKIVGMNRLRGVQYDIYELVHVPLINPKCLWPF